MFGSTRRAAKVLGISKFSVSKYVRKAGVDISKFQHPKGKRRKIYRQYSAMADWLRLHPNTKLPKSIPEITKLTGLSYNTVKCYLWRRRERQKQRFVALVKKYKKVIRKAVWRKHNALDIELIVELVNGNVLRHNFTELKLLEEELWKTTQQNYF